MSTPTTKKTRALEPRRTTKKRAALRRRTKSEAPRSRGGLPPSASSPAEALPSHTLGFLLGRAAGWAIAPLFGLVSFVRRARTFHPRGPIYHATVARHVNVSVDLLPLADRLAGPAIVRFSGALWKRAERGVLDVLGCAVRFTSDEQRETARAERADQDLLFATIRRPWTMALSPFTTNVHDYLGNDYFAVSPFDVGLDQLVYFRLHPTCSQSFDEWVRPHSAKERSGRRSEKLQYDVEHGRVLLTLEVGADPFGPWRPLASIELERKAHIDGEALRFRPFRSGRGVHPRGFVHALRLGVYSVSQRLRPSAARG